MKKSTGSPSQSQEFAPRDPSEREADAPSVASAPTNARRPYRRPEVSKRRSLSQATLVSGGGTGGSLAGGML